MMRAIGALTGKSSRADYLVQKSIESLKNHKPIEENALPTCIYLIWNKPLMAAGHNTYINHMLPLAGFKNALPDKTEFMRYPEINSDFIRIIQPEYLLLSSEPYPFAEKHIKEFNHLFPGSTTVLVDGEMFSWYGSRTIHAGAYFTSLKKQLSTLSSGL